MGEGKDVQTIVRETIEEFLRKEQTRNEPAHKAELLEERRRREQLEKRVNELVDENRRSRQAAEQAERSATIRSELQRLGVTKVDLAYKAVRDDIQRTEDGRLVARGEQGEVGVREYLTSFVSENPEFLPARIAGGSGTTGSQRTAPTGGSADLDKIRPGMSAEEAEKIRQEIIRVAGQVGDRS
jgi:hypothetical protein